MDGFDVLETFEIFCIEGEDAVYTMDVHCGGELGVMHLDS